MNIEINGDALKLLEDFIKYSKINPAAMADVMMYDFGGFNHRRNLLEIALRKAGVE